MLTHATNDHDYSATSATGAKRGVVAMDVSLTVEDLQGSLAGCILLGCYDASVIRPIGEPVFWLPGI